MGRKPSHYTHSVTFRCEKDTKSELIEMAEEHGVSLRQLILNAVAYYAAAPPGPNGVPLTLRNHKIILIEDAGEANFAYVPKTLSKTALRRALMA